MNRRVGLFGMEIDALRMQEATEQVLDWVDRGEHDCRYVVTPNVDHTVVFQHHEGLRHTYANASLVVADGTPVVVASRLLGRTLPECVTGADLVPAIFDTVTNRKQDLRVYLLGARSGVAARAAEKIAADWPTVEVVGTYSPSQGFENDSAENDVILASIAEAEPDILIVGLGAPKQELWVHRHHERIRAHAALCVGATIDFIAGEKSRAPVWMRRAGLEWLHRVSQEPRRLSGRYLRDAWIFPRLVWRQWRSQPAPNWWVQARSCGRPLSASTLHLVRWVRAQSRPEMRFRR